MERTEYKSYWELRNRVQEMTRAYSMIGFDKLNERGLVERRVYASLSTCFEFSDTKGEVVGYIRNELQTWDHLVSLETQYKLRGSDDAAGIAKYLRQYVRHNFERELWEHIPEFAPIT